jgi:hypothetical protein
VLEFLKKCQIDVPNIVPGDGGLVNCCVELPRQYTEVLGYKFEDLVVARSIEGANVLDGLRMSLDLVRGAYYLLVQQT